MNFKEFIESLGKALGMRLENAGGACGLDVDGVTVMIHDADDLVLLTAEIGPPPPEEGGIWLEKYDFLERLDGEKGVEMLTRFAETARTWRDLVAGFKPDVSSGGDPSRDLAVGDFMQV